MLESFCGQRPNLERLFLDVLSLRMYMDVFSTSYYDYDCYTSIATRNKDWDGLSVQKNAKRMTRTISYL